MPLPMIFGDGSLLTRNPNGFTMNPMADDELITIRTYGSPQDAYLAKSVLAGESIPACIVNDSITTWLW